MSLRPLVLALLLAAVPAARAHTVWLEPGGGAEYLVRFGGHGGALETYSPEKLVAVMALAADGTPAQAVRIDGGDGVRLRVEGEPALLALHFDNGYWSRTADGASVNRPMTEVEGAVSGVHAVKYHKFIVAWSELAARPIGQPFELVPRSGERPRPGEPLALQVLIDGRPAAGIALAFDEEGREAVSDAQGHASLVVRPGVNRIWAGQRVPLSGDARATQRSTEYILAFDAGPKLSFAVSALIWLAAFAAVSCLPVLTRALRRA